MIKRVGLTGGIGSGKSTVARIFEVFGFAVYFADDRAKWIMNNDATVKREISNLFGENIYNDEGLDRKKLAGIVFNDKAKLEQLNAIVHPATRNDFNDWATVQDSKSEKAFVLQEAAILFETGGYKMLDGMINVHADQETRLQRVMKRDGVEREAVLARMEKQVSDDFRLQNADFNIYNDGSRPIIPQVIEAIEFFEAKWKQ